MAFREMMYKILQNPFRYYRRAAGFTFCLTAVSNTGTALFDGDRREFLTSHPQLFFSSLLFKSSYFGLIFPAFYATALTHPRQAFFLGGSIEEGLKEVNNISRDLDDAVKEIDKSLRDLDKDIKDTTKEIKSGDSGWWFPGSYYKSTKTTIKNGETVITETINGKTTVTTIRPDGTSSKKVL